MMGTPGDKSVKGSTRAMGQVILGFILGSTLLWTSVGTALAEPASPVHRPDPRHPWKALLQQANSLNLPTEFLQHIDPKFVTLTFEDLRTYAAEYHPENHTMILNMRLSFNEAKSEVNRQLKRQKEMEIYKDWMTNLLREGKIFRNDAVYASIL